MRVGRALARPTRRDGRVRRLNEGERAQRASDGRLRAGRDGKPNRTAGGHDVDRVLVLVLTRGGEVLPTPFLDITDQYGDGRPAIP
jgi:hypothetical protein